MNEGELLIRCTIRLAMVCYAAVLASAIVKSNPPATTKTSRWLWTIGCGLFVVHVLSAFAFYHHWSHQHAFDDTQAKTAAAIGVAFGWGIYVNHLFTLAWVGDVAWCWLAPQSHRGRPWWMTATLHTFMLFITINGLMIFKTGPTRWVSLAVILLLLLAWCVTLGMRRFRPGSTDWEGHRTRNS